MYWRLNQKDLPLLTSWYPFNNKCVQRIKQFPEPRSGSACRRTTIDYLYDQWCVWPKMLWSNKRLGGSVLILKKTISFRDLAETIDTAAVLLKATKQPITCKGLNHETYDVSLQNLRSRPFWICLHFEFYFYPFSVYLQAKHDSFCE